MATPPGPEAMSSIAPARTEAPAAAHAIPTALWLATVVLVTLNLRPFLTAIGPLGPQIQRDQDQDRKSTRLNSSHSQISYAVFCLKKKKGSPPPRRQSSSPWHGYSPSTYQSRTAHRRWGA